MNLHRASDIHLNHGKYLRFVNEANIDNEDWVPFDSIESLRTFVFSSSRYDASKHYVIVEEGSLVADLYIRSPEPEVAEIMINILKEWRDKGLAADLLSTALSILERQVDVIRIILSAGSFEVLPLARAKGFNVVTQVDLIHDLKAIGPIPVPEGYEMKTIGISQLENVTVLRNQIFGRHGAEELEVLLKSQVITVNITAAVCKGEYVGYCIAQKDDRTPQEGLIAEIGVEPGHRSKGVGRSMLQMNLEWLRSEGCKTANVNARSDNTPALELYKTSGFKIAREKEKILEKHFHDD